MQYQDLEIQLRSTGAGDFDATVAQAPLHDCPRVHFDAPLSREDLVRLIAASDDQVRRGLAGSERETPADTASSEPPGPREIGRILYQTVFHGDLGDLFLRCQARLDRRAGPGLRLRLRFSLNDQEAEYLAGLPWELLYDPRSEAFLATDRRTPVVRDLTHPQPPDRLTVDLPLHILVVDAAPSTQKELNLALEIERLEEALEPLVEAGKVRLSRLDERSPEAMRHALLAEPVHVLHFMGHGGFHDGTKMGAVFFELDDGSEDQVDGEAFADSLKGIDDLRLVVLNSCKTARHAGHAGAPLYHGVASAIVERTGMPAVIANQYAISDQAAIDFSSEFYRRLAAGDPVEAALSEARLSLWRTTPEWATPVLFLSAPDGVLFDLSAAGKTSASGSSTKIFDQVKTAEEPYHLGIRSRSGWGESMEAEAAEVLSLLGFFHPEDDHRYIRDREWWQQRVFPEVRRALLEAAKERRPLLLDFAAHQSIAFAAGWVLEAKSGLDVRVWQRTQGRPLEWSPDDRSNPGGPLWQERPDLEIAPGQPDRALALAVSNPELLPEVKTYIERKHLPVGRIFDVAIAPEPGQKSVRGGEHSLRLAQALVNRLRHRRPSERGGRLHLFASAPNALLFYLGQLSRSLGQIVLYEYAFDASDRFSKYQPSIELPPPDEAHQLAADW